MADLDLLDLLSADHENLVEADRAALIQVVLQHLTVERDLLHPAVKRYLPGGEARLEELRAADRDLEGRLARLEHEATPDHEAEVRSAISEHVEHQEPVFEQLRASCPEDVLSHLADGVVTSIGGAPKHPHPGLLHHGRIGEVVEELADIAAEVRDKVRGEPT
jgi:hypothetical protein